MSLGRTSPRRFSRTHLTRAALVAAGLWITAFTSPLPAQPPADIEFFEKKIRPLLVDRCYECHSAEHKIKAGLRLDHAEGWLTGGESGPALVPGKPDASRLIRAIRYN